MKLIITRSFSLTKQVAAFEPINAFCSVSVEEESGSMPSDEYLRSVSQHLDNLVRREVERTIESEMKKVEEIKKQNTF